MITVAFTRPAKRLEESVKLAESMGFRVFAAPSLEIMDGDAEEFQKAERQIRSGEVDIVIVGSETGVEECTRVYGAGLPELLSKVRVISIGSNTTEALRRANVRVDSEPEDYSSYGLIDLLEKDVEGKSVLLIRSDKGSKVLFDGLVSNGAKVTEFAAYKLKAVGKTEQLDAIMECMKNGELDAMAFTSPMSAETFFSDLAAKYGVEDSKLILGQTRVAAIGGPTAMKLEELGRIPDIIPEKTTFKDMLEAIKIKLTDG